MRVERIGVHDSVAEVFPPRKMVEALADLDVETEVVGTADLDVDALVTFAYEEAFLDAVEWIHSIQAGVDRFPFDDLERRGVVLTNSHGIHGDSVGEMVVGYMVGLARDLPRILGNQYESRWEKPRWDRPFTLVDETVCVVGLGTLGRGIATRADAMGMHVTGVKRTPEPVAGVETVYSPGDLHDAIADARFVVLAVPLNEETERLVATPEFETMREDGYLVNVARGPVVDESALVEALDAGDIAGAALDVFETEPLPADSPLWGREDVLVTPHSSAIVDQYYADVAEIVRENLRRLRAGEAFTNRVV